MLQHRGGIAALASNAERGGVGSERQPRVRGPAAAGGVVPRDRGPAPVPAARVDHPVALHHRVGEAQLLALVQERGSPLGEQQHRRGAGPGLGAVAGAMPWHVVVRQHPARPSVDRVVQVDRARHLVAPHRGIPRRVQRRDVERQVQLVAVAQEVDDPLAIEHVGLTDQRRRRRERIGPRPQLGEAQVHPGTVVEHAGRDPPELGGRVDVEPLADGVHDVDAEAVDATIAPEAQDVDHRRRDLGVVPVQVGLFGQEEVQVVLTGGRIQRPGRVVAERGAPVGRRTTVGSRVAPHVPVATGVPAGRAGLAEPRVTVRGVPGNEVQHDPQARAVSGLDQPIGRAEVPEERVDVAVVVDVVAEVGHGGAVERREPHRVHAQVPQVAQAGGRADQVADAVAVRVSEAPWVHLVDDSAPPPRDFRRGRGRHRHTLSTGRGCDRSGRPPRYTDGSGR